MPHVHLLIVNLGTPAECTAEAVREFLAEFLSDPDVVDLPRWIWQPILHRVVLRRRPQRVAEQYATIWTPAGSPLRVATERLARRLRDVGAGRFSASAAYRYGEPSIDGELGRLAREHAGPIIVVPLFPQRTQATTGTAFQRARTAASRAGIEDRLIERLIAPDDAGYIAALVTRWREAVRVAEHPPEHLVISFHGIPVRYDRREGHTYTQDCSLTTNALLAAMSWPETRTTLAFQSRFGPEPWLKPATSDVLVQLARRGVRHLAVITPGFLTEGLETLEEIGVRGRDAFVEAGGTSLTLVPAVEDASGVLDALSAIAMGSHYREDRGRDKPLTQDAPAP